MKKVKWLSMFSAVIALMLMLAACSTGGSKTSGETSSGEKGTDNKTYTIKFGHHLAEDHSLSKQVVEFKRLVEEKTNGHVKVEVYPAGQLGQQKDLLEGLRMGTVDMTLVDTGVLANFYKPLALLDSPYLFDNIDQSKKALSGELSKKFIDGVYKETTIRVLSLYPAAFRTTVLTEKAVKDFDNLNFEDFKGLKLRTLDSPSVISTFKSFGVTPVAIPSGEVYSALQTHVVEGVESNPEFLRTIKIDEVAKYIADTKHVLVHQAIALSDKKYNELPKEYQDAVTAAVNESTKWYLDQAVEIDTKAREALTQNGMKIKELDLTKFKKAALPFTDQFVKENHFEDFYQLIEDAKK
jgi:TRAP-type transport system periplasmic protein